MYEASAAENSTGTNLQDGDYFEAEGITYTYHVKSDATGLPYWSAHSTGLSQLISLDDPKFGGVNDIDYSGINIENLTLREGDIVYRNDYKYTYYPSKEIVIGYSYSTETYSGWQVKYIGDSVEPLPMESELLGEKVVFAYNCYSGFKYGNKNANIKIPAISEYIVDAGYMFYNTGQGTVSNDFKLPNCITADKMFSNSMIGFEEETILDLPNAKGLTFMFNNNSPKVFNLKEINAPKAEVVDCIFKEYRASILPIVNFGENAEGNKLFAGISAKNIKSVYASVYPKTLIFTKDTLDPSFEESDMLDIMQPIIKIEDNKIFAELQFKKFTPNKTWEAEEFLWDVDGQEYNTKEVNVPDGSKVRKVKLSYGSKSLTKNKNEGAPLFYFTNSLTLVPINRLDNNGNFLPGSTLRITNLKNNEVVEEWITTNTTKNIYLQLGEYKLEEINVPDGYNKAKVINFELSYYTDGIYILDGNIINRTVNIIEVTNKEENTEPSISNLWDLSIEKFSSQFGSVKPQEGAIFEAIPIKDDYSIDDENKNVNYTVLDREEKITKSITNNDNNLKLKTNISYLIKEIKAPENHLLDLSYAIVKCNNNTGIVDYKRIGDTKEIIGAYSGIIGIYPNYSKHFFIAKNIISDLFKLDNPQEGFVVGDYKYTNGNWVKNPIDPSKPKQEGTFLTPPCSLIVLNEKIRTTELEFIKYSEKEDKKLSGALFKLEKIKENGEIDQDFIPVSWESSEQAKKVEVPIGKYKLTEEKAPDGYKKIEPVIFIVDTEKNVTTSSSAIKINLDKEQKTEDVLTFTEDGPKRDIDVPDGPQVDVNKLRTPDSIFVINEKEEPTTPPSGDKPKPPTEEPKEPEETPKEEPKEEPEEPPVTTEPGITSPDGKPTLEAPETDIPNEEPPLGYKWFKNDDGEWVLIPDEDVPQIAKTGAIGFIPVVALAGLGAIFTALGYKRRKDEK